MNCQVYFRGFLPFLFSQINFIQNVFTGYKPPTPTEDISCELFTSKIIIQIKLCIIGTIQYLELRCLYKTVLNLFACLNLYYLFFFYAGYQTKPGISPSAECVLQNKTIHIFTTPIFSDSLRVLLGRSCVFVSNIFVSKKFQFTQ